MTCRLLAISFAFLAGAVGAQVPSGSILFRGRGLAAPYPYEIQAYDPVADTLTQIPIPDLGGGWQLLKFTLSSLAPDRMVLLEGRIVGHAVETVLVEASYDGGRLQQFSLHRPFGPTASLGFYGYANDELIVMVVDPQNPSRDGLHGMRQGLGGPSRFISAGPAPNERWGGYARLAGTTLVATAYDRTSLWFLDTQTGVVRRSANVSTLNPQPGDIQAILPLSPTQALVVCEWGYVILIDLPTSLQVVGTVQLHWSGNRFCSLLRVPSGIWIRERDKVYQLGMPSTLVSSRLSQLPCASPGPYVSVSHNHPVFMTYGQGCAGSRSEPPWIDHVGAPALGNAGFAVTLSRVAATVPATLLLGAGRSSFAGLPLPLSLRPFGMLDCELQTDAWTSLSLITDGSGTATLPMPVPNQPALVGKRLTAQWLVADPASVAPVAVIASEGAEIHPR